MVINHDLSNSPAPGTHLYGAKSTNPTPTSASLLSSGVMALKNAVVLEY